MLRSRSSGRARTSQLEAVYYDTDDLRLRREGSPSGPQERTPLRTDPQGQQWPGGAALARGEWEAQLSSPEPDPGAVSGEAGAALAGLLGSAELRALSAPGGRQCDN